MESQQFCGNKETTNPIPYQTVQETNLSALHDYEREGRGLEHRDGSVSYQAIYHKAQNASQKSTDITGDRGKT